MNIARKIVDSMSKDVNVIVEVGAGMGVLTQYLIQDSLEKLRVVEIDTESIEYLKNVYPQLGDNLIHGDFLRTAANKVAEDCPEIDKVEFDVEIFRAFTKGYLESASSFLTSVEKDNLPYAVALFPFMQAVRFFADYVNGDTYYKIAYPEHNLVRARSQMYLAMLN